MASITNTVTLDDGGLAIVRVKPLGAGGGGVEQSSTGLNDGEAALRFSPDQRGIAVLINGAPKVFKYPKRVIPPSLDNAGLYDQFLPQRVEAFFNGVNVNVMAYGQTGTGKTHTMFGPPGIMERAGKGQYGCGIETTYGLFPRAIIHIFQRAKALGDACVLTCSAIELSMFGNKCMFDTGRECRSQGMSDSSCYGVTIDKAHKPPRMYGMVEHVLDDEKAVLRVFEAIATRNTKGTGMNNDSSRTHCFVFLKLYMKVGDGEKIRISRFQFVDLAGSERIEEATGSKNFRESNDGWTGMVTNFSLTMLSACVRALVQQRAREKKTGAKPKAFSFRTYVFDLVLLLSESMQGSALTAVIVCCSQAPANASQTTNALDFGSVFAKLRVRGKPVKPVLLAKLIKDVKTLKTEAERVLASSSTSVRYTNIRKAQKLDADNMLRIFSLLRGGGGGGGGGGRGTEEGSGGSGGDKKKSDGGRGGSSGRKK